jgi:hypothetical protein
MNIKLIFSAVIAILLFSHNFSLAESGEGEFKAQVYGWEYHGKNVDQYTLKCRLNLTKKNSIGEVSNYGYSFSQLKEFSLTNYITINLDSLTILRSQSLPNLFTRIASNDKDINFENIESGKMLFVPETREFDEDLKSKIFDLQVSSSYVEAFESIKDHDLISISFFGPGIDNSPTFESIAGESSNFYYSMKIQYLEKNISSNLKSDLTQPLMPLKSKIVSVGTSSFKTAVLYPFSFESSFKKNEMNYILNLLCN